VFTRPVVILLTVTLAAAAVTATAYAVDGRELDARQAYAAGRYQEAIDLYSKLYAATLHPTYLRNIGRCYQNLEEPSKAIKSYQEYLRKASVTAAERREVEGFIAEMEALRDRQVRAAASAPATTAPAVPAVPPAPASPPAAAVATPAPAVAPAPGPTLARTPAPGADLTESAAAPSAASPPFYTRWWFWTAVGVAVAAGGAAFLLSRGDRAAAGPTTDYGPYAPEWK
jgi:hypothetical protein